MYVIRNLWAVSKLYKYGNLLRDGADTVRISLEDRGQDGVTLSDDHVLDLPTASEVILLNDAVGPDCHVSSYNCRYLDTILYTAERMTIFVMRGFHFSLSHDLTASSKLTTVSLCNVHFPAPLDVLSLLSQLAALEAVYLHYVTCETEFPSDMVLPSTLEEVVITSDHTRPAREFAAIRLQDHFLRWAVKYPERIPNIRAFAMWDVEDATVDLLEEFISKLYDRNISPANFHVTVRDGQHYATSLALGRKWIHKYASSMPQGLVQLASEVNDDLPVFYKWRF